MNIPVGKNRKWVASLHRRIETLGDDVARSVMSAGGADCTSDLLALCGKKLGKPVTTVEELVQGWNGLRESRGLQGLWELEGAVAHGVFHECGCALVRSGLIELHPVQCLCSEAMMQNIFSTVAGKPVEVLLRRSIGRGDEVCEFIITI
jgi:predicted hydrocarbon binding protein